MTQTRLLTMIDSTVHLLWASKLLMWYTTVHTVFVYAKLLLILGSSWSILNLKCWKSKLVWSTLLFKIKGLAIHLCSFCTRALRFRFRVQVSSFAYNFTSTELLWIVAVGQRKQKLFLILFLQTLWRTQYTRLTNNSLHSQHFQISTSTLEYLVYMSIRVTILNIWFSAAHSYCLAITVWQLERVSHGTCATWQVTKTTY